MREGWDFPKVGRAAPTDFQRVKLMINHKEQPCQPQENPVLPDSFTKVYILFITGVRISAPRMHRWICIGLPKANWHFCIGPTESYWTSWISIGPPESVLALLNPYWPSLNAYTGNYDVPYLLYIILYYIIYRQHFKY